MGHDGEYAVERETGFEPATSTLARLHSTTELLPHGRQRCIGSLRILVNKETARAENFLIWLGVLVKLAALLRELCARAALPKFRFQAVRPSRGKSRVIGCQMPGRRTNLSARLQTRFRRAVFPCRSL